MTENLKLLTVFLLSFLVGFGFGYNRCRKIIYDIAKQRLKKEDLLFLFGKKEDLT
jgi:hypothetical protein